MSRCPDCRSRGECEDWCGSHPQELCEEIESLKAQLEATKKELEVEKHRADFNGAGVNLLAEDIKSLEKELELEREKLAKINTPLIENFLEAVENEAKHQRLRWGSDHDAGKTDADWFWLIGYLAGKAINKPDKKLHHIITTAAACLNWHAQITGDSSDMRPGIAPEQE